MRPRSATPRNEIVVWIAGMLLITVAMAGGGVSSYLLWQARERVEHTHQVRSMLVRVLSQLQDIETGQRGYIITGDEAYLEPYLQGRERIDDQLDRLAQMTAAHPVQQARVEQLRMLAVEQQAILEESVEQRRANGFEAGERVVLTGQGRALMDQARALIAEADREAALRLARREAQAAAWWRWLVAFSVAGWVVGMLLVTAAAIYAWHSRQMTEAAQQQFRALFESAPGAYLVIEPGTYRIVAVSDTYLQATMTQRQAILGKTLFEVFPDDPADPAATGTRNLRASLQRVEATRRADAMTVLRYPIPRPASAGGGFEQRWWSPLNSPVCGPDGKLTYIIHRVEDVTPIIQSDQANGQAAIDLRTLENRAQQLMAGVLLRAQELQQANEHLKQSEEQLRKANGELADFAAIVSHDLKSPLRAVSTLAGWLKSDYDEKLDDEGRDHLDEMVRRVGRMDRMIDDILEYARLGRSEGQPTAVDLTELVTLLVQDLDPPANVQIEVPGDLPTIEGDPVRLRQLFQNLIGNAIKHNNKPQAQIRVTWTDGPSAWTFGVMDNGPGIEPKHHERIFRMFQTLVPRDKTDSTGVGLALVKRIVDKAGGRIWVESHLGTGSTFYFTWPKAHAANGTGVSAVAAEYAPGALSSPMQQQRKAG